MKFDKKGPKTFPKPSQTLPKPSRNRSQQALGAHVGPMLRNISILDVKKNRQKAPKSAQETPQTVPDPPTMEPKTFPNRILKRFFTTYFLIRNSHGFVIVLKKIFAIFYELEP